MANVINATSTGNGGLVSTGDDSGILNIQTNETTAITVDASQNTTFAGKVTSAGALTLASNGTTTAVTIDTSQNVGIGTASPYAKIQGYQSSSTLPVNWIYRGAQTLDNNLPTTYGFPYLQIGRSEYRTNSLQTIGFGYVSASGNNQPAEIGFLTTSVSGETIGDLVFATRSVTTNTAASERMRIDSSGNLLVGTTALNVDLYTKLTLSNNSGTTKWAVGPYSGGATNFIVSAGSSVGVFLNGTSATSWSSASDERTKENLVPITNAIKKVCSLRSVTGNYIADEQKTSHAFLIAQDVQTVLPEAVGLFTSPNGEEILGLAYTETIPLLVAAIKEQQALITAQAETINALTARIEALENK